MHRPRANGAAAGAQVLGRMKQLMVDNNTAASHSFLLDDDSSIPFSLDDIAALMEDKARRRRRALARLPVPLAPGSGRRPKRPGPGMPSTAPAASTAAAARPPASKGSQCGCSVRNPNPTLPCARRICTRRCPCRPAWRAASRSTSCAATCHSALP
jgi:hypothetical protein